MDNIKETTLGAPNKATITPVLKRKPTALRKGFFVAKKQKVQPTKDK